MNKFTKKFKSLLILILALTMALTSLMTVACKKKTTSSEDDEEETTTITEKTDYQVLTNGDFEFGTANTAITAYPASPTGWSKSYDSIGESNATTSSYGSGIIDTREYKYEYDEDGNVLLDEEGNPVLATDDDGEYIKVFDSIASSNAFPKYAYEYTTTTDADGKEVRIYTKDEETGNYIPKKDDDGNYVETNDTLDTEFFYYNPGTPFDKGYISESEYSTDDETNISKGGKILMIHNKVVASDGQGTAQYYKSSTTLSLGVGESGLLEVWVLTKDLKTQILTSEYGAYVSVASTVGSISTSNTVVKNINTYGNWSKIEIYVEGSAFAKTTLTVTLGLGFGSSSYSKEFVEGFAFFDNVHFKTLKADEIPADETPELDSVISLYNASKELITDDKNLTYSFAHTENDFKTAENNLITTTLKINAKKDLSDFAISGNAKAENYYESDSSSKYNIDAKATVTDNVLTFEYVNPSTLSFETENISVDYEENVRISFYVKTELLKVTNATKGLTIYLMDKGVNSSSAGTEVSLLADFKTTKGENKDNDDFTLVSVIVSNTYSDAVRYFSLKFVLGTTESVDYLETLPTGTATIKDFKSIYLTDTETENLSTSDEEHATKRTLQGEYNTLPSEDTSSDSYYFSYGLPDKNTITYTVADAQNYKSVRGGSSLTGGNKDPEYTHIDGSAGLINSKYIDNYSDELFTVGTESKKSDIKTWLEKVAKENGNKYAQPLMINNKTAGTFGYYSSEYTLNSSSTYCISVKVKIYGDAKAYIYLVNTEEDNGKYYSTLSVDEKTNEHTEETIEKGKYAYAISLDSATAESCASTADGFVTVRFLITTGKNDGNSRKYRLELWNGSRDGETTSQGIVFFDSINTDEDFDEKDLKHTNYTDGKNYIDVEDSKVSFTQLPTLIKTDANPDGVLTNYEKTDSDHTSVIYMTNGTLENGVVKNGTFILSDLTSVDAELEVDNTSSDDDDSSDDDTTTSDTETTSYSPFLYATSLIVSLALIIALVAVLVKHIISAHRKKMYDRESYYDTSAREKAHEKILNKKTEAEKEKKDYDYDNPENNVESEENVSVEDIQAENAEIAEDIENVLENSESVEVETGTVESSSDSEEAPVENVAETEATSEETSSEETND